MLLSLAMLLFISPTVTAITDLQTQCTGTDRVYSGTSCYVIVGTTKKQDVAKTSCNHYLGYAGHLVHIRSTGIQAAVKQLMNSYSSTITNVWTGMELINSSVSTNVNTNWGNYYRNGTFVSPTYLSWAPNQPSPYTSMNRVLYYSTTDGMFTAAASKTYPFVCEYEEALKQPVTDLETKCVALTSPLYPWFVDDVCYLLHDSDKNFPDAKVGCNALNGYNGHLAHVRTINELWVAEALRSVAGASQLRIGIEQTDLSSTDGYNGWYLTTPTDQPVPTTYLPWAINNPIAGEPTIGIKAGYPKSFETLLPPTKTPFICQYASVTTTTTTMTTPTTTETTTTTTTTTTPTTTATTTTTPTVTSTAAGANCTVTSAWTTWSACSQSCDKGIRSREIMFNNSENCNITTTPTPAYQYESCATGVQCKSSSTKMTLLKSECMGKVGSHFAYSSCYFLANISGTQADASDYCVTQGGQLASLFGEDLVSQLGSLFLQSSSVQAWIGLKVTGGKLKWMVDNKPHALFKNISTPPTGSECYVLVSDRSSQNKKENPRLSPMDCSASLQQAICMKSDHIYSSYSIKKGKKVIEAESPESASIEVDFNACGARCSEIIGCVGFNFNPSGGSCIPTKVSPAMPSVIDGVTTYTVQIESSWNFYERI
uniref:C-type lectin domain-containing protein n=1 Tax=Plectus sambesii TaxID=2011161 RepID=A0A914WMK4_9BILA